MQTLLVDFNMREPDGRVPALLLADRAERLAVGDMVVAVDGEGLECVAVVSEISPDRRYAMLDTRGRGFRPSTRRPSASDLLIGR
jgi:hypothetical protein